MPQASPDPTLFEKARRLFRPDRVAHLQTFRQTIAWVARQSFSINPPLLIGYLVTALLESLLPAALALTGRGLLNVLVDGLPRGDEDINRLLLWLVLAATLAVSQAIISNIGDYWQQCLQDEINLRVILDVLHQEDRLDLATLESGEMQGLVSRARKYGTDLVAQVLFKLVTVVNQSVRLCSLIGILLWIEPLVVGWFSLLALPYLLFKWRLSTRTYAMQHRRTLKHRRIAYFTHLLTHPRWLPEIKFFQLAPLFIERFRGMSREFLVEDRRIHWLSLLGNTLFAVVGAVGFYVLFMRIARRVLASTLTVGDVAIYMSSTLQLQNTVQTLIHTIAALNEQLLHLGDIQAFLVIQPPTRAVVHGAVVPPPFSALVEEQSGVARDNAAIEFINVSFAYPGNDEPVLSNLSFRLEPGETVALLGENGAGKSTLAKLLARLYEPTEGCIRFGGIDLRDYDRAAWQNQLGFVFQNFTFYEATVRENIAYGNWPYLDEHSAEVAHIAYLAGVDSFIARLPQGYDTLIGRQFGTHELSVGQWQRMAIARGLARPDARLLILDEPSASLDARAEHDLFAQFRQAAASRITLLISHRFSTINMADRVLVLEKGRLAEWGTHHELLAQGGQYAALYRLYQQQIGS